VFTISKKFTSYNELTGILFVARKYKNESYLSVSVDNQHSKAREHTITKVKIPYFFVVTVQDKIGEYTSGKKKGKAIIGTQDLQPIKEPFPKEWDIVITKPVEITFLNECTKCGKVGRPRIDKKNKDNYHYPKYISNQKEEYRLIYNHKDKDGKRSQCVIAKFDKKHGIFLKTGKISKRVNDYIFPNYLIDERNI